MPFADITKPPAPLPEPRLQANLSDIPGVSLLPPLTRRGKGAGLVLLYPDHASPDDQLAIRDGVPSPLVKWAEEGYAVVEVQARALRSKSAAEILDACQSALDACIECEPKNKVGFVAYDLGLWKTVSPALPNSQFTKSISGAVVYASTSAAAALSPTSLPIPMLLHLAGPSSSAGASSERSENFTKYFYPEAASALFAQPFQPEFTYRTEALSHTRSLTFLKPLVGGPYFDLETIWEEHAWYEFGDRSVEHTMSTMVAEPYVNHVTTMTGGIGRASLTEFYRHHFVFSNPDDTAMELISRTVGIDRVIEEFIFKFEHVQEVPWLVPGIPPTGRKVEIPMMGVINIRGDRLYHEHISWDQGTVLTQLGLLPEYLPFPYPVPGGDASKKYEYRLPVAGAETAAKLRSKGAVPSNGMFEFRVRERTE